MHVWLAGVSVVEYVECPCACSSARVPELRLDGARCEVRGPVVALGLLVRLSAGFTELRKLQGPSLQSAHVTAVPVCWMSKWEAAAVGARGVRVREWEGGRGRGIDEGVVGQSRVDGGGGAKQTSVPRCVSLWKIVGEIGQMSCFFLEMSLAAPFLTKLPCFPASCRRRGTGYPIYPHHYLLSAMPSLCADSSPPLLQQQPFTFCSSVFEEAASRPTSTLTSYITSTGGHHPAPAARYSR